MFVQRGHCRAAWQLDCVLGKLWQLVNTCYPVIKGSSIRMVSTSPLDPIYSLKILCRSDSCNSASVFGPPIVLLMWDLFLIFNKSYSKNCIWGMRCLGALETVIVLWTKLYQYNMRCSTANKGQLFWCHQQLHDTKN